VLDIPNNNDSGIGYYISIMLYSLNCMYAAIFILKVKTILGGSR